jgi:hypothetical protein
MNVEIGTEAPIFLFWEYLLPIFDIFSLQCRLHSLAGRYDNAMSESTISPSKGLCVLATELHFIGSQTL